MVKSFEELYSGPIGPNPQGSVDGILTSSPTYYNSPKEFKEIDPTEGKPNEQ